MASGVGMFARKCYRRLRWKGACRLKTTVRAMVLTRLPDEVVDLMARYCAAERYAYARRRKGEATLDLEKTVATKFGLNSRYAKDSVFSANVLITAQTELVKLQTSVWAKKLHVAKAKLAKAKFPLKQKGLEAKVAKRQRKLAFWQKHKEAGTHPPVVFGGRKAFHDRCAGKISREEWHEGRSHRLVSRGDKTKGGNLNLRVVPGGLGGAFLEIAVPGRSHRAPRIVVPIYLPRKVSKRSGLVNGIDWRGMVLAYIATGKPYQVEVIQRDGKVYCHITLEEAVAAVEPTARYLGVDTNPAGLAATQVQADGNFKRTWWLGDGELTYARTDRRSNRVGELAAQVVDLAMQQQATLVIEDLKFADDHEVSAKFHRVSHQFVYRGLLKAIERRALRQGVPIRKVHPAYTSVIGILKYAHQYRLTIHQAAALVIARRGMGLKERVPQTLVPFLRTMPGTEWKAWAGLKKATITQRKQQGGETLVSWPMHRKSALGLA
jgi:IS605 OrfB family transposase